MTWPERFDAFANAQRISGHVSDDGLSFSSGTLRVLFTALDQHVDAVQVA
jgi:hypothetical protein